MAHAKPASAITGIRLFVWQLAMRASLHDAAPERKRIGGGKKDWSSCAVCFLRKAVCRAGGKDVKRGFLHSAGQAFGSVIFNMAAYGLRRRLKIPWRSRDGMVIWGVEG